jgi:hypothetical protein
MADILEFDPNRTPSIQAQLKSLVDTWERRNELEAEIDRVSRRAILEAGGSVEAGKHHAELQTSRVEGVLTQVLKIDGVEVFRLVSGTPQALSTRNISLE